MACSCRAGPWKAFVRGLAQVHKLEAHPATSAPRLQPYLARTVHFQKQLADSRHARQLHTSRYVAQEAAATEAPEAKMPAEVGNSTPSQQSPSPNPNTTNGQQVEKPERPAARTRKQATDSSKPADPKARAEVKTKKTAKKAKRDTQPKLEYTGSSDQSSSTTSAPKKQEWQVQKAVLKEKFPQGWRPQKRLSPDALAGIRALNTQFPDIYTTKALADKFEVSPEAIRRILKSKWQPNVDEEQNRQERWFRRGMSVWERKAALGVKPPRRWRDEGIARDPAYHERSEKAAQREKEREEEEIRRYKEERAQQAESHDPSGDKPT